MYIVRGYRVFITLIWVLLCLSLPAYAALDTPRQVNLQLKWKHAFQFAGYYAAIEQGYYQQAGFEVSVIEAKPGIDPVTEVMEGRAHYGVGNSSLLLHRHAGRPVVVLNVIFQHSPAVLISRGAGSTATIDSLKHKRIMIEPNSDELLAFLKSSDITADDFVSIEHSYNVSDLIEGNVDAISAYSNYEPYLLNDQGFYFHIFTPRESGIDFYGDNLFTSREIIDQNPADVEAFRQASLKGWEYALSHQEKMISLILEKYAPDGDPQHLRYEAQKMQELLAVNLVEVGYMNRERWKRIIATYQLLGYPLPDTILEGFIYQPYVSIWDKLSEFKLYLAFAVFVFSVLGIRHYQLEAFNRRLSRIAREDALTGIFNRKHLDEALVDEHQRSIRYDRTFSVIMIDVDNFKAVNDEHGHYVGDEVLRTVVASLTSRIRSTDILGRWGGEEFLLVCPETAFADALTIAEALRVCIEQHSSSTKVTASFGVAAMQQHERIIDLVKRADQAMYQAKQQGRNRVIGLEGCSPESDPSAPFI